MGNTIPVLQPGSARAVLAVTLEGKAAATLSRNAEPVPLMVCPDVVFPSVQI